MALLGTYRYKLSTMLIAFNQSLGCPYEDRHMSCACRLCGDPEHWITLCENNSIKTENIDGYIIKFSLVTNIIFIQFYILASLKIKDIDFNHYSNSP